MVNTQTSPKPDVWLKAGYWMVLANVLFFACAVYFFQYGVQKNIFWDENYHVTSAQRYLEGIAHFEAHPPLGKMLIALGEQLSGANAGLDKHVLTLDKYIKGEDLPAGFQFTGMRLLPTLFGVLSCLVFYWLALQLLRQPLYAMLASGIFIFENAYIVHFRAVHLDSFQIFFTLLFIALFVRVWLAQRALRTLEFCVLGVLFGLAVMVKVNALVLGVVFVLLVFYQLPVRGDIVGWCRYCVGGALSSVAGFVLVVVATFSVSLWLTPVLPDAATPLYEKDRPWMSETYVRYLRGERAFGPQVVGQAVLDYVRFMNQDHRGVVKYDPDSPDEAGSPFWMWPFQYKNINYRWDSNNGLTRYVQLAGNHWLWLTGVLSLVASVAVIVWQRWSGMLLEGRERQLYRLLEMLVLLYWLTFALHGYLSAQRVMYLYHYFLGLLFSFVIFLVLLAWFIERWQPDYRWLLTGLGLWLGVAISCFVHVSPLTYALPLSEAQCQRLNTFHQTVKCVR
ncbi:MAG: phospholipid carrier-dependent glycosyltransferase [Gammaproteobacteria bacterium]|nr:phospholipid carrier-dependent glycosyltransferase [Gammaproteobacteria bacterium]